jgi:S1-C subfamily serine protease
LPISEIDIVVHNPVNTFISFALLISVVGGSFYYVYATDPKEPYLGIRGMGVTPAVAEEIGLQEASGLLIFIVDSGSPADLAGLRGGDRVAVIDGQQWALGGDVIIAVDGVQIQGIDDAEARLADKVAGDSVRFAIIRGNATLDVSAVIGER